MAEEDNVRLTVDVEDIMGPDLSPVLAALAKFVDNLPGANGCPVGLYVERLRRMADSEVGGGAFYLDVDADDVADLIEALAETGLVTD